MSRFIETSPAFLANIATGGDRIPTLYYAGNRILRRMFWQRLHLLDWLIGRHSRGRQTCLDFGGGAGVMLPTLSRRFERVCLVDLQTAEATQLVSHHGLTNVALVGGDIGSVELPIDRFDAIVAADVLEHFSDLDLPLHALSRWLAPDGVLFTSLPTENWVYALLRRVFGVEKPADHYHTGYEVEARLRAHGFKRVAGITAPLVVPLAPLFLISAWRHDG
jgi:predicted TPR repeat methyltransferase